MSERSGTAATEATAKAAAAKRTPGRRKPTTKGGGKPVGTPAPAKPAPSAVGRRPAEPAKSSSSASDQQEQIPPHSPLTAPGTEAKPQDRGLRRAIFLAELAEAKELRRRVAPRRARAAELHARVLRTFRY
jgi:hypothetical protein